jgi:large subunit ribosomal protein L15
MVIKKRKKNTRQRGGTTHGYGSMKKNRGFGNKGGKGHAGSGKRADSKKPSYWKNKKYFGKHGFKNLGFKKTIKAVNLLDIEQKLPSLVSKKLISKENDIYVVDLKKIGFNKLLGKGKPTKKYKITTEYASKNIIEKIKKAGGEVILKKGN